MAIVPGEQKNGLVSGTFQQQKQRKIIYLVVLTVILLGLIVYFGFFRESAPIIETPTGVSTEADSKISRLFESLKNISLDISLFKDKKFQGLNIFGEFPINQGTKGRENPFDPIVR